ncbi:MAG: MFS transporter [Acidimicrobiales bacterium]
MPPAAPDVDPGSARTGWTATTFAALSIRPYRFLWLGGLFSFLAVQMQMVARGWLAYELTGTNSSLGAMMFGFGVPMLLLTPWGGVAADRFGKRRIILIVQWLLIVSSLLVAFALVFDALTFPLLVASASVQGAAFAFLGPSRMAFTGELVGRKLLPNAIVLQQMSMNGTRVFGPSLAGVLIGWAWFGAAGVYFATAAFTFVASAMTLRLPSGDPDPTRDLGRPVTEFLNGLRYVKRNPHLALLLGICLLVVMTAFPYIAFLPTLADDVFQTGSSGFGFMSGATAIGAVAASLFIAGRSGGPRFWLMQVGAGMVLGAGLIVLRFVPEYWMALLVLVVVGGANSGFQAINNSMTLMISDSAYHGRVQSLMMLSFSLFGLMALPLGIVADAIGLRNTMAIMGGFTMATMGAYLLIRPAIERRHPFVYSED